MSVRRLYIALSISLAAGCAHSSPAGPVRFVNQPPAARVNDRLDVPDKPEERSFVFLLNAFDKLWVDAVSGALELRDTVRARNVNSIDEVPDSTWFHNRIGVRELSVDEVRRGPHRGDGPTDHLPWTIKSSKVGGNSVGFIIKDATGQKYLLKFDVAGMPEMETGAHVIVQRILWACGYNVPDDEVVYFDRDQLRLGDDAAIKDVFGTERPMTERFVDAQLRKVHTEPGKPIRGMLSRYIDGIPIGGFAPTGTRDDDPNDTVPHQHRRELRGLQPIAAWVGHTDVKEGNTLDAWATDPADPNRHYLVHYLIDFGKSLGMMADFERWQAYSFAHIVDWPWVLRSTVTLGLWPRPWDDIRTDFPRGIGLFESDGYDPGGFRTNLPFEPFSEMDRFDGFWGAALVIRFTRPQLQAIVEQARYSDPAATRYMVDTLVARQRKTARYWFRKVAPLARFRVTADGDAYQACFEDLMLAYDLEDASRVSYRVRVFDYDGALIAAQQSIPGAPAPCIGDLHPGPSHDGYVIVRLDRRSGTRTTPPAYLHLARSPDGALRIIGLWRQ